MDKEAKAEVDWELNDDERQTLLKIARTTIDYVVQGKRPPEFKVETPILTEHRGAFVTIHKHNALRGCIGYVQAFKPLYLTVSEMAEAASLRDPRFFPVTPAEVADIDIEISVLTPIREIQDVNEIQVGKHGIIIERDNQSGLLLPQVATEYGWDRETFLDHTCRKAGLPKRCWKEQDTVIKVFAAEVFGEKSM
jgi:AmmeMemoRadiSam system protein A